MIRSAVAKLTLWYLTIILVISAIFSVALYRVLYDEISQNAQHQHQAINRIPLPVELEGRRTQLNRYLDTELDAAQHQLLTRLGLLNAFLVLLGAGAAYGLARRTLRPIQNSLEAQGRFTADASHELRTPLTAMRTEIEVALRDKSLSAIEARELLGSNLEEIAKLEALSSGLLRLARSENGLDPAIIAVAPVKALFESAAERFAPILAERHIQLDISAGPETVAGDQDSLVELVAILLDNAIKYSPDASKINLASTATSNHVRLIVADHGLGIDPADQPHIFDRFYRADHARARKSVGGYGLGLSIAKRIADLHQGVISVVSAPGKGTTFSVKLPIRQAGMPSAKQLPGK